MVGSAVSVASGSNVIGEPTSLGEEAKRLVVPLTFSDIYEIMVDQGIPAGTAISMLSIFGMSASVIDRK